MPFPAARRLNLRLRLGLWYSLFQLVTTVLIGVFLLATLQASVSRSIDDTLAERATRLAADLSASEPQKIDRGTVTHALEALATTEVFAVPGSYVQVLDAAGAVIGSSENAPEDPLSVPQSLIDGARAGHTGVVEVGVGSERIRVLARPLAAGSAVSGVILVSESLGRIDETLVQAARPLGIAGLAAVLLALLGSWWLMGRALQPIVEVTRVAKRIAATGQVEERVAVPAARDELYELASTLNEMLARQEQTVRRQRQFMVDASHELRGPLMVIRGNLDLLQMDMPSEDRRASAREATEEAERMAHLVGDLLFLAERDAHERLDSQPVALNEVVDQIWQRVCGLDAGKHELVLECNEPAIVVGDPYRLGQMIWNLVDNALRYTNPGGQVRLCLRNHGQVAELAVTDTGIGIPAAHLPHIFERFYRVDRARSRNESSTGLGLPIIKQVAETHGGQVRVHSEAGIGTAFTVALPVAHQD